MSATFVNKFNIFFLGMKYALKQIWSKLLTSLAKIWKCEAPFCFRCTEALVDPLNTPSKCKAPRLSALDHFTCCYTYPCVLMQALTFKEQVFCSNAYKQALSTENEKSESSHASESFGHKKLCWQVQIGDQTHLTLSFGPKSSLAPHSTPLYFFHAQFRVSSPVHPNWGFSCPLSTTLQITLIL